VYHITVEELIPLTFSRMSHEVQDCIETGYEPSLSRLTDPQRLLSPGFTNGFPPQGPLPWRALPGAGNFHW
jgi:hypothetical protein